MSFTRSEENSCMFIILSNYTISSSKMIVLYLRTLKIKVIVTRQIWSLGNKRILQNFNKFLVLDACVRLSKAANDKKD